MLSSSIKWPFASTGALKAAHPQTAYRLRRDDAGLVPLEALLQDTTCLEESTGLARLLGDLWRVGIER
ncbi:MAG TPA: hypothetical protein VGP82_12155 [Ktedonobacterales bacterium]|jgi:hypothetical protein|nr:hypothetical protein [Ktedonobacterales bacterium]